MQVVVHRPRRHLQSLSDLQARQPLRGKGRNLALATRETLAALGELQQRGRRTLALGDQLIRPVLKTHSHTRVVSTTRRTARRHERLAREQVVAEALPALAGGDESVATGE